MTQTMGLPAVLEHGPRADGPGNVAWLNKLKRAQFANTKGVSVADIAQACDGVPHRPPAVGILEDPDPQSQLPRQCS